jgi:hypothetical protein
MPKKFLIINLIIILSSFSVNAKNLNDGWKEYEQSYYDAIKQCTNKVISYGVKLRFFTDLEDCIYGIDVENLSNYNVNNIQYNAARARYEELHALANETQVLNVYAQRENEKTDLINRWNSLREDIIKKSLNSQKRMASYKN